MLLKSSRNASQKEVLCDAKIVEHCFVAQQKLIIQYFLTSTHFQSRVNDICYKQKVSKCGSPIPPSGGPLYAGILNSKLNFTLNI